MRALVVSGFARDDLSVFRAGLRKSGRWASQLLCLMRGPRSPAPRAGTLMLMQLGGNDMRDVPQLDLSGARTVLAPSRDADGHWVGGGSVCAVSSSGPSTIFYLITRRRAPRTDRAGDLGERGFLVEIRQSTDGVNFGDPPLFTLRKEHAPPTGSVSMERFCLFQDGDGLLHLLTSWLEHDRWVLGQMLAEHPSRLELSSWRLIEELHPSRLGVHSVKDPVLTRIDGIYHMFVSTFLCQDGRAPTSLATSADGQCWRWHGICLPTGASGRWDHQQARIDTVIPTADGLVAVYSGSPTRAGRFGDTRERSGYLASPHDPLDWVRITPDAPVHRAPDGDRSLRYLHLLPLGDVAYCYFESASPGGGHQWNVTVLPIDTINAWARACMHRARAIRLQPRGRS